MRSGEGSTARIEVWVLFRYFRVSVNGCSAVRGRGFWGVEIVGGQGGAHRGGGVLFEVQAYMNGTSLRQALHNPGSL